MEKNALQPLNDRERRTLLTWSAVLCAIPLCLAPLAGRSSFELASERAAFDARFSPPSIDAVWNDKPVVVARDPFVPERKPVVNATPAQSVIGMHVTQGQPIGFVVPSGTMAVRAVVTGASPRALIDDGARVRVVGIGDMLAGFKVVGIDRGGVHLQNGTVMPLPEENP